MYTTLQVYLIVMCALEIMSLCIFTWPSKNNIKPGVIVMVITSLLFWPLALFVLIFLRIFAAFQKGV